jgi:hypothetical protein
MKTYCGNRPVGTTDPGPVSVIKNELAEPLAIRNDLVRHAAALNWGYYGSGPAQLAFALLMDVFGDAFIAGQTYQAFKEEIVSGLGDDWSLTDRAIGDWVRDYRRKEKQEHVS